VRQHDVDMVTSRMIGAFRDQPETRHEFLSAIGMRGGQSTGQGIARKHVRDTG
jgi:hypothetical protein